MPLAYHALKEVSSLHLTIALCSLILPLVVLVYLIITSSDLSIVLRDELFLFASMIGFIISFLSFYTYSLTGSRRVLWLSAGFFMISMGLLLSSLSDLDFFGLGEEITTSNAATWNRQIGALSGWLFILLGTARKNRTISENQRFRAAAAVVSITIISTIVLFGLVSSLSLPPLYVEELGWTDLSIATSLAIFSIKIVVTGIYGSLYLKSKNEILFYFVIGFILSSYTDLLFTFGRILDLLPTDDILLEARFLIPLSFASLLIGLLRAR